MKEVTKEEFERLYFTCGGGSATGWSRDYWNRFYAGPDRPDMKFCAQPPETPEHTRMMIVADFAAKEHRMFFVTEEEEERFFDFPGRE